MKTIVISLQERWAATRGVAHKNKKKYSRKGRESVKLAVSRRPSAKPSAVE
jgi:hypothetical protein